MKRYRPLAVQFDNRAMILTMDSETHAPNIRELTRKNIQKVEDQLKHQFGEHNFAGKKQNFIDIDIMPFSVIAYHNNYLNQIRNSYIIESYFTALTGACSLGERMLNHMVLAFRDQFKHTKSPKRLYSNAPLRNWELGIKALSDWDILLPKAAQQLHELKQLRHESLHYNPITDAMLKDKALESVRLIQSIIKTQFGAHEGQPWYFFGSDDNYVKKEYEAHPFVKHYIIPNCRYLSPFYKVLQVMPWEIIDYEDIQIDIEDTDDNYRILREDLSKRIE